MLEEPKVCTDKLIIHFNIKTGKDISDLDLVDILSRGKVDLTYGR